MIRFATHKKTPDFSSPLSIPRTTGKCNYISRLVYEWRMEKTYVKTTVRVSKVVYTPPYSLLEKHLPILHWLYEVENADPGQFEDGFEVGGGEAVFL